MHLYSQHLMGESNPKFKIILGYIEFLRSAMAQGLPCKPGDLSSTSGSHKKVEGQM